MSMTTRLGQLYTLTPLETVHGTINIYVDSVSEALTQPENQTVLGITTVTESASIDLSSQEMKRLEMSIVDCHDNYLEGFWAAILNVDSIIALTLTEGETETCFFHGMIEKETVRYETSYTFEGVSYRKATFTVLSSIQRLFDVDTEDWVSTAVTGVIANCIALNAPADGYTSHIISVKGLFAAMLAVSELNSTYDLADITFVAGTNIDFKFYESPPAGINDIRDLYVPVKYRSGLSYVEVGYFKDGEDWYLPDKYAKLSDLLPVILKNFAVKLNMDFDWENDRYAIKLFQYYRAYDGTLDFGTRLTKRTSALATNLIGDAGKVTLAPDPAKFVWSSNHYSSLAFMTDDPANYPGLTFDLDMVVLWKIRAQGVPLNSQDRLYCGSSGSIVYDVDWYDYQFENYVSATDPLGENLKLEQALCGYNVRRFAIANRDIKWKTNTSTYAHATASDGATESIAHIGVMRRASITDGTATAKNYFVNKFKIDFPASETEIEWIQEEL